MATSNLIAVLVVLVAAMEMHSLHANIAEYDEYWTNRAKMARKAIEDAYHPDPYNVTNHFNHHVHLHMKNNNNTSTRRGLEAKYKGPCKATNPIDACWRCDDDWEQNRMRLADCALGFGRGTTGGKGGRYYVVTDPSDDDMVNPKPGTLRHAVIQDEPLWIIFSQDMNIRLSQELMLTDNKTIDARGANVHVSKGAQITLQFVQNVIIHGLHVHDIFPGAGGLIRDSISHFGWRTRSDGDGISIFGSSRLWIDHVSLARCSDGLIDAIEGSTAITISNVHMTYHDDVFLFGAHNKYLQDKKMQVTVAFNHFGTGLVQRMPRCRFGFFHVVNNDYTHWIMYAIGGSMNPTILSHGNRFIAPSDPLNKEVTYHEAATNLWQPWIWRSQNDLFMNGAYFRQSGWPYNKDPYPDNMIPALSGQHVAELTKFAGPRKCRPNVGC